MDKTKMINHRERMMYLNIIAEKDQEIARLKADRDGDIKYYKRAAEYSAESKRRALRSMDERRKDVIAFGICAAFLGFMAYMFALGLATFPTVG